MGNGIKYSASAQTQALKKGNFWIATGDVGKGSDYYSEIPPPSGGYTIYLNKASDGPSIICPTNDAQLIYWTKVISGNTYATAAECLNWFAGQSDKMVFNRSYPAIVTNGLVLNVDAGFTPSYPTTGTTWYDMSSAGNNGTLTNGPTYSSDSGGCIIFDGADDYTSLGNVFNYTSESFSFGYWVNFNSFNTNAPGQGPIIFYKGAYNTNGYYLQHSTTSFSFVTNQSGSSQTTTSVGVNTLGVWYYIVVTRNGSSVRGYVNGVDTTGTAGSHTNPASSTDNFTLARYASSIYFNGKLSNFTGYNRALSATEVLQNYNAQKSRFGL